MLITLQDDGVLRVYDTADSAVIDVEALDAEEVFRAIYDENGQPYVIDWLVPNEYRTSFFGLKTAKNGEYRLVPKGDRDSQGLLRTIQAGVTIEPSQFEATIRDIERRLKNDRK